MKDYKATILSNVNIGRDGKKLTVRIDDPPEVRGGHFAMLKPNSPDLILRRPLGIADARGNEFTFVYQIKGKGTKSLAVMKEGDTVQITLPLGRPFDIGGAKTVAIIGGGYGIIPLLLTAKQIECKKYIYTGFASKDAVMLEKEFSEEGELTVCTDDGSAGFKGFPTDAFKRDLDNITPDIILCCGPEPLMRAVKALGESRGIKTLLSLEQRMGCGIGACLVCTCKANGINVRVCANGPVFNSKEVFN